MRRPVSNGVSSFSSLNPFILYAFVMGNRMLLGSRGERSDVTFKQQLNQTGTSKEE